MKQPKGVGNLFRVYTPLLLATLICSYNLKTNKLKNGVNNTIVHFKINKVGLEVQEVRALQTF